MTYIRMGASIFASPLSDAHRTPRTILEVKVMSLANISIVGNLVRPPDQVSFESGRVKTTFVVAVNRDKDVADFYRVETWGKLAELAGKYLLKGNQVTVSGRLSLDNWTDKQGVKRTTPVVKAEQLSFPPRFRGSPQVEPSRSSDQSLASPNQPSPDRVVSSQVIATEFRSPPDTSIAEPESVSAEATAQQGEEEEVSLALTAKAS